MRVTPSAIAAAAVLGAVTVAYAAGTANTTTGTIKSIDMSKPAITLDNGLTYDVAKGVSLAGMKAGEKVTLTYTQAGKTRDVTAIKPVTP